MSSVMKGLTTCSIGFRRLCCGFVACGLAFALQGAVADTLVGTLPGEIAVDSRGTAGYSIPLVVPPGTAGMVPTLGLTYTSGGGNGLLGVGWSISGLSAITRVPATKFHDDFDDPVDYDNNDRFMLDGQRLILVNGENYGDPDSEYRTEVESFQKIIAKGTSVSGPAWFEVRSKDGLIREYGKTGDARYRPEIESALFWSINKVTDSAGNYINFQYYKAESEVWGRHRPTKIEYTGNTSEGLTPYSTISFEYEPRPDLHTTFAASGGMRHDKRLKKIVMKVGTTYVRDYRLVYELSPISKRWI